ncbi:MAG: beta-galactosidase [Candidatus Zipacnadales bacterium]
MGNYTLVVVAVFILSTSAWAQQPPAMRNLLVNSSFEEIESDQPIGWHWHSGAARATFSVDTSIAHSGHHSIKITNPTASAPHAYGRLSTSVRVTEGRTYTLSCYVRSTAPGRAWIGSGTQWQFRFAFPVAEEWTRVIGTFEADAPLQDINIVSESPTEGVWVDDVQLEPGSVASPYVYQEPLPLGDAELVVFQGEWLSLSPNLVKNSSFETLDGGLPKGWAFDRRNTDATMLVDETVAHSGRRSLKFTNSTPFGAHVYCLLASHDGMLVEPNQEYTLSCYVRSEDPGIAWIGGGPGWHIRQRFPRTNGTWERVSVTFRTGEQKEPYPLLIVSESPTNGFWIDDVKLEVGSEPTLYLPEEAEEVPRIIMNVPPAVVCGPTLSVGAWVYLPQARSDAVVLGELQGEGGTRLARASWQGALAAGVMYVEFRWSVTDDVPEHCTLAMNLASKEESLVSAKTQFSLHTVRRQRQRLAQVRTRVANVRRMLERAREQGFDGAYPLVSLTVADNFCGFVQEDLDHWEVLRAEEQLDQIEASLDRAEDELEALLEGKVQELVVPRYVTSPIEIQGTSFIATVQWPDGHQERRPVFFHGYGHFGSVKRDLEKLPDYGLNIIQVEFGPNSTVPREGELSTAAIEEFERLLERAAASNVAVNLLLSPHYFPQWAYEKWPEIGGVNGGFIQFSVDAPQTRAVLEQHLRLTASRLKGKPALHSYCLSNEPIYIDPSRDPHNCHKWTEWLKARYKTLEAIKAAHRTPYESFETVPIPVGNGETTTPLYYDWCRFNNERFADWHTWMADVIHEEDPSIPVHVKTMNTLFWHDHMHYGVDQELFCGLSQIAGNDSWKYYSHNQGDWANGWQGENMHFDLQRSCCGKPIFNSENHVIVDGDWEYVPGAHIRNIMWQAAIHGQGASTMWVWERTFDKQSSFAGSIMHRPECADEHGRVALDLMRLAPEVTAFQQAPARIAIIYSISSLIYGGRESERQLHRVYRALNFIGEKLDFITERQLAQGQAERYAVLVAPGVTHLPIDALEALCEYERLIITAGADCLTHDDLDRPSQCETPRNVVPLPEGENALLRDAIVGVLTAHDFRREVILLDAKSSAEAWGVEWESVRHNGRLLVNVVNYTQEPLTVRIEGPNGPATELISDVRMPRTVRLKPLVPVLLAYGKS